MSGWEIPERAGKHILPAGKGHMRRYESTENRAGYPEASVIEVARKANGTGARGGTAGLLPENGREPDPIETATSEPSAGSGNLTGPS